MDGGTATPELIYRSLILERGAADKQSRTIPASLSSEAPYTRNGEVEVLSHEPDAIDLSRAKDGLPLLFCHDSAKPIGIVEGIKLENKTLRGMLRFGKSALATEVYTDVLDGVLRNLSIGYSIQKRERVEGGFRATRFTLYEASIVSVPADYAVGIGRSFNSQGKKMETQEQDNVVTQTPAVQSREADIRACVRVAKLDPSFADELLASAVTTERAREIVLNRLADNDERYPTRSAVNHPGFDFSNSTDSPVKGMADAPGSAPRRTSDRRWPAVHGNVRGRYGAAMPGTARRAYNGIESRRDHHTRGLAYYERLFQFTARHGRPRSAASIQGL